MGRTVRSLIRNKGSPMGTEPQKLQTTCIFKCHWIVVLTNLDSSCYIRKFFIIVFSHTYLRVFSFIYLLRGLTCELFTPLTLRENKFYATISLSNHLYYIFLKLKIQSKSEIRVYQTVTSF